jgi:hypothetical protein
LSVRPSVRPCVTLTTPTRNVGSYSYTAHSKAYDFRIFNSSKKKLLGQSRTGPECIENMAKHFTCTNIAIWGSIENLSKIYILYLWKMRLCQLLCNVISILFLLAFTQTWTTNQMICMGKWPLLPGEFIGNSKGIRFQFFPLYSLSAELVWNSTRILLEFLRTCSRSPWNSILGTRIEFKSNSILVRF